MAKKVKVQEFPAWAIVAYRWVRAAVGAFIAQVAILQPDWTNREAVMRTFLVAFMSGFVPAFGKALRDYLDKKFGYDEKSNVARFMPI